MRCDGRLLRKNKRDAISGTGFLLGLLQCLGFFVGDDSDNNLAGASGLDMLVMSFRLQRTSWRCED
jgi:hypothetical protein